MRDKKKATPQKEGRRTSRVGGGRRISVVSLSLSRFRPSAPASLYLLRPLSFNQSYGCFSLQGRGGGGVRFRWPRAVADDPSVAATAVEAHNIQFFRHRSRSARTKGKKRRKEKHIRVHTHIHTHPKKKGGVADDYPEKDRSVPARRLSLSFSLFRATRPPFPAGTNGGK